MHDQNTNWLLSHTGADFPFVSIPDADRAVANTVVDAYFVSDLVTGGYPPFVPVTGPDNFPDYLEHDTGIKWVAFDNQTAFPTIEVRNSSGEVLLNTFTANSQKYTDFGIYRVYEAWDTVKRSALVWVVNLANWNALGALTTTLNLVMGIRNTEIRPARIYSITAPDALNLLNDLTITNAAEFKAGYNMQLVGEVVTQGRRKLTRLQFNVVPGLGDGKSPVDCDETDLVLRSINNVTADAQGNLVLQGDNCYWWEVNEELTDPTHSIQLSGDCKTCFSCDDVDDAYRSLMVKFEQGLNARNRICNALVVYNDYLSLLQSFIQELDDTKFACAYDQTDDKLFSFVYRLQVGAKLDATDSKMGIKSVTFNVTSDPGSTMTLVKYSGKLKLPTRPQTVFAPGVVDVDEFSVAYSTSPSLLKKNRYAMWYWAAKINKLDAATTALINVDGLITFDDNTTQVIACETELTIVTEP